MKQELLSRLKRIEETIASTKELGEAKLESFYEEVRAAFTQAFTSLPGRKDILDEIGLKRAKLKSWRLSVIKSVWPINFKHLFSMPFIYGMVFPVLFLHISLEIYHQVCFRFYGIPLVKYGDYFIYDRQLLPYLNWLEKINCFYCSYVNNVFRYAVEIGGRTERFWCPIKYHRRISGAHSQYSKFVDYLDGENFREKLEKLRDTSDL